MNQGTKNLMAEVIKRAKIKCFTLKEAGAESSDPIEFLIKGTVEGHDYEKAVKCCQKTHTQEPVLSIRCRADHDGHCSAPDCPQARDGEPEATGRLCPLDVPDEDEIDY